MTIRDKTQAYLSILNDLVNAQANIIEHTAWEYDDGRKRTLDESKLIACTATENITVELFKFVADLRKLSFKEFEEKYGS